MKIKVIGRKRPVLDGEKRDAGYTTDVTAELGARMVANGLVEEIAPEPKKTRAKKK